MATGSRDLTPGGHPDLKPVRARREANTIMDFYDLADFSEPLRHGVPVGPQALDLAAPEVWCAWVRACAEAKSAERREAANNRLREERAQRNVAALRRRTTPYEAAEPFPWWAQPSPPLIASGHTGPGTGIPEAVRLFRESPAGREKTANRTARKSVLARLAEGTLRAFARPGNGRAPWHWILAHEWASGDATRDQRLPGAITLSGSMYWMAHIFDPIGVPLDQAAVAYGQAPEATKMHARAAIGRRMAGGADRDAAEESALAAERGNLLSRLRAGALFAFRGGAELPREEFEREGALGEISTWERADDVLVRPPPPPRAAVRAEGAPSAEPAEARPEDSLLVIAQGPAAAGVTVALPGRFHRG